MNEIHLKITNTFGILLVSLRTILCCYCRAWWSWSQKITTTSGPRRRKASWTAKVRKKYQKRKVSRNTTAGMWICHRRTKEFYWVHLCLSRWNASTNCPLSLLSVFCVAVTESVVWLHWTQQCCVVMGFPQGAGLTLYWCPTTPWRPRRSTATGRRPRSSSSTCRSAATSPAGRPPAITFVMYCTQVVAYSRVQGPYCVGPRGSRLFNTPQCWVPCSLNRSGFLKKLLIVILSLSSRCKRRRNGSSW